MDIPRKYIKSYITKPLSRKARNLGLLKNYSYYQDYLREVPAMERAAISNTEYLNAKTQAGAAENYMNYLREVPRNRRSTRKYTNWKRNKSAPPAPANDIIYTENPMMRRGLPSALTLASDPAGSPTRSRSPSPNVGAEGGRRKRTRRVLRSRRR